MKSFSSLTSEFLLPESCSCSGTINFLSLCEWFCFPVGAEGRERNESSWALGPSCRRKVGKSQKLALLQRKTFWPPVPHCSPQEASGSWGRLLPRQRVPGLLLHSCFGVCDCLAWKQMIGLSHWLFKKCHCLRWSMKNLSFKAASRWKERMVMKPWCNLSTVSFSELSLFYNDNLRVQSICWEIAALTRRLKSTVLF